MTAQGPLGWNIPIVNKDGTPTKEFMQKWATQRTINGDIPQLSTPEQVSAILDILAGTDGDLLRRGATLWSALGTDDDPDKYLDGAGNYTVPTGTFSLPDQTGHGGEVLNTDGTDPFWAAGGGGGGGSLASGTITAAATLDIDLSSFTTPSNFEVRLTNLIPASDNVNLRARVSDDAGATFKSGASDYTFAGGMKYNSLSATGIDGWAANSASYIGIMDYAAGVGNGAAEGISARIRISNPFISAAKPRIEYNADWYFASDVPFGVAFGGGMYKAGGLALNAIRFYCSAGNIASCKWSLYGFD